MSLDSRTSPRVSRWMTCEARAPVATASATNARRMAERCGVMGLSGCGGQGSCDARGYRATGGGFLENSGAALGRSREFERPLVFGGGEVRETDRPIHVAQRLVRRRGLRRQLAQAHEVRRGVVVETAAGQ